MRNESDLKVTYNLLLDYRVELMTLYLFAISFSKQSHYNNQN